MKEHAYVIGVDFGTDSVRAIVADAADGRMISSGVAFYPRWKQGKYQHPEQAFFRQHPKDYLESFEACVKEAVEGLPADVRSHIRGIGIDATGSTPAPVDEKGTPLALLPEFSENENAMFYLWKDHSAWREAEEINRVFAQRALEGAPDYRKYMGSYSSEWFWSKVLHGIRSDSAVKARAFTWAEHCDWMAALLTGCEDPLQMYRNACTAGYKVLWHSDWGGAPDAETLQRLDPYLALIRERFQKAPLPAAVKVGRMTKEWARRLGLPDDVSVAGTSLDAHAGAVGAGVDEHVLVCTLGTSAVNMTVAAEDKLAGLDLSLLTGYGGLAQDSILPGYIGIESGQAAFGDLFAWFKRLLEWPGREHPAEDLLGELSDEAQKLPLTEETFPVILDWFNGRRYPEPDDSARSAMAMISLGTTPPMIYRSLAFAAVAGLNRIYRGFEQSGIRIDSVRAVGGISKKSPFVMQMMADVLGKEVQVLDNDFTCALGAAVYASVAAGIYDDMREAVRRMSAPEERRYLPDPERYAFYCRCYEKYLNLAERSKKPL